MKLRRHRKHSNCRLPEPEREALQRLVGEIGDEVVAQKVGVVVQTIHGAVAGGRLLPITRRAITQVLRPENAQSSVERCFLADLHGTPESCEAAVRMFCDACSGLGVSVRITA